MVRTMVFLGGFKKVMQILTKVLTPSMVRYIEIKRTLDSTTDQQEIEMYGTPLTPTQELLPFCLSCESL